MRRPGPAIMIRLLLFLALLFPAGAGATIYSYTDANGVVHFSNVPTNSQYRPVVGLNPRSVFTRRAERLVVPGSSGNWQPNPNSYDHLIRKAASRYLVDPHLVKAVIRCESNFDCLAVSSKGAVGLMQLMPETVVDMNVADPFDPRDNINGGTHYLRKMLALFKGNLRLALAAYNAGPNTVISVGGVPPWQETMTYIEKVQYYYQVYQRMAPQLRGWIRADYPTAKQLN